jgi:hypothetical protein
MTSNERNPETLLADLAALPRRDDLARLVHTLLFSAADERRTRLSDGLAELAQHLGLSARDAETPAGNILHALERGDLDSTAAPVVSVLLARGIALSPPDGAAAETRVLESLVWLAANTPVDALSALDAALVDRAAGLWKAAAALVRRVDSGASAAAGRAGALIAAAALRASASPIAHAEARALAADVRDPILRTLLRDDRALSPENDPLGGAPPEAITADGELMPPPRGPVAFVLLAFTGILAVLHVGRLVGRWVLRYRRPAAMRVSPRGVTVTARTEILGRTLKEQELHIPVESLLRATREVRFPRLATYAGLFALALGSYVGISLFVDGARAGSPELLGMGALLVAVGVALDFVLVSLSPSDRARCRLVVVPRKGPALAVGGVDVVSADAALRQLTRRA